MRLNVDRMRRHQERNRQHADARTHRQWLASLTPEHRSVHEQGRPCGECIQRGLEQMGRRLGRALAG